MNQEVNNGATPGTTDTPGKAATYRRANRQGRNRPVLVNSSEDVKAALSEAQAETDETSETMEAASTEVPAETTSAGSGKASLRRSLPKFFSTIGRKEETGESITVDAAAARLARATRGAAKPTERRATQESSKPATKASAPAPAKSAPTRAAQPARKGGFKPKHLIGILLYLLVADLVGVWEKAALGKNDRLLFTLGPLQVTLSTVLFLLTLVILLVVLARFDLVPRSLAPASSQSRTAGKGSQASSSSKAGDSTAQPSMKQGVKGSNDELYQEYRQNVRYWQRKDRKK
jgi:hypothetical protein